MKISISSEPKGDKTNSGPRKQISTFVEGAFLFENQYPKMAEMVEVILVKPYFTSTEQVGVKIVLSFDPKEEIITAMSARTIEESCEDIRKAVQAGIKRRRDDLEKKAQELLAIESAEAPGEES